MTATGSARSVRSAARRASNGPALTVLARTGLAAHGVIWLLLGILAAVMAFSGRRQETDQHGALQELAGDSGGLVLLVVIAAGLAAYALWKLVQVFTSSTVGDRVTNLFRALVYGALAASAVQVVVAGRTSSQKKQQQAWTATVMAHTGGRWLVGAAGLVVIGLGGLLAYRGARREFEDELLPHPRVVTVLGALGSTARGVVVALVGVLVLVAAITFDPKKATGVDGALRTVRDAPAGSVLLAVVAIGLAMFGVFGLCEAKYKRVDG